MLHNILALFAATEVFIYVFMELVTHMKSIRRVIDRQARWYDTVLFILLFGGFSIFGTYIGIVLPSGAISSIRDLGPMMAGVLAGPLVGLVAGLIGGIHRYFYGGWTALSCGLATILAGVMGGFVYLLNKKKLLNIFYCVLLAVFIEFIHGLLAFLIVRPFDEIFADSFQAIPAMMVANGMGAAICILVLEDVFKELKEDKQLE